MGLSHPAGRQRAACQTRGVPAITAIRDGVRTPGGVKPETGEAGAPVSEPTLGELCGVSVQEGSRSGLKS